MLFAFDICANSPYKWPLEWFLLWFVKCILNAYKCDFEKHIFAYHVIIITQIIYLSVYIMRQQFLNAKIEAIKVCAKSFFSMGCIKVVIFIQEVCERESSHTHIQHKFIRLRQSLRAAVKCLLGRIQCKYPSLQL